ncbi:CHAT domain-containing protein [Streptomyces sp. NPDC000594]|uniref:CHAT domain-containing protein n=1 Tax=Streptomyces sp. NPDC000594 TaxID=3154261 RepID=UPI00332E2CF8
MELSGADRGPDHGGPEEPRERARRAAADALPLIIKTLADRPPGTPSDRPFTPGGPGPVRVPLKVDPALLDRTLAEVAALETELAAVLPDDDPDLALLRARLGGLCTTRYLADPTDDDRGRGLAALRAARASGALDPRAERSARGHLVLILHTPTALGGGLDGSMDGLRKILGMAQQLSRRDPELLRDQRELSELMTGMLADLGPGQAPFVQAYARTLDALSGMKTFQDMAGAMDVAQQLAPYVPGIGGSTSGFLHEMRRMAEALPAEDWGRPLPEDLLETEEKLLDTALGLVMRFPGLLGPDDMRSVQEAWRSRAGDGPADALMDALARMGTGLRTGDYAELPEAARLMGRARAGDAPGWAQWLAEFLQPALTAVAGRMGGNLMDRDQARESLRALLQQGSATLGAQYAADSYGRELQAVSRLMHTALRLEQIRWDSPAELDTMLAELLRLRQEEDPDSPWGHYLPLETGMVRLALAARDGSLTLLRDALADLDEATEHPGVSPVVRPLLDALWPPLVALSTWYEPDATRVRAAIERARRSLDGPSLVAGQQGMVRLSIAYALTTLYETQGGALDLAEAIRELERAWADLDAAGSPEVAQRVLWGLAEAYGMRGDRASAVMAARDSLRIVAEDVLLQLGAEHGLEAARAGASRALSAARWAAAEGRADQAVESLETGRAMVLRSVAASTGVAARLDACGEHELAERWRTALRELPSRSGGLRPVEGARETARPLPGLEPGIPSELRRRALDALREAPAEPGAPAADPLSGVLGVPAPGELRDGVRAAGVDALVHLVPGTDKEAGLVLLVPRAGEPRTLWPDGLDPLGQGPLKEYLDAGAHRSAVRGEERAVRDAAHERWETALEALCDWAGEAVMGPLLTAVAACAEEAGAVAGGDGGGGDSGGDGEPVRLVLVPCGNLGVVPWHAARLPSAPGSPPRYVCERAVVSYAASGGEFLRAAGRERRRPDERVVLVTDPTGELEWAQDEVTALREAHYPGALLYGWHDDLPEDAPGTPGDVLSLLPGGLPGARDDASLVHLVVHGMAGLRPTDSVLQLASPDGTVDGPEGRLTVTQVLDVPPALPGAPGGSAPAGGPLVVLSACETDLSSRDHDEALTPTTALLARGATDVVGSRWEVVDGASAALMVVFHHHLTTGGLAPPDALRAAQRWMLDPDRRPVPGLRGALLTRTERSAERLASVSSWAAFIHQGNPSATGRTGSLPAGTP